MNRRLHSREGVLRRQTAAVGERPVVALRQGPGLAVIRPTVRRTKDCETLPPSSTQVTRLGFDNETYFAAGVDAAALAPGTAAPISAADFSGGELLLLTCALPK